MKNSKDEIKIFKLDNDTLTVENLYLKYKNFGIDLESSKVDNLSQEEENE